MNKALKMNKKEEIDTLSKQVFERARILTRGLIKYLAIESTKKSTKKDIYLSQNHKLPTLIIYNFIFCKIFQKKLKEDFTDFELDLLSLNIYYNNRNILQYFYSLGCPQDFPFCIWMNKLSSLYLNEYFF